MADGSGSGSSAILGVIIGAIIVVAVAFYAFGGMGHLSGSKSTTVNVGSAAPSAPATTR